MGMLFGVDPGVHTGMAWVNEQVAGCNLVWRGENGIIGGGGHAIWKERDWTGEWRIADHVCDTLVEHADKGGNNVLCLEGFVLYGASRGNKNKHRDGLSAVRVASNITALLMEREIVERLELRVVMRFAIAAKSAAPDWRLKKMGLFTGLSTHERDAFRHIVRYVRDVPGGIRRVG